MKRGLTVASIPTSTTARMARLTAQIEELDRAITKLETKTYRRLWFYLAYFGGGAAAYFFAAGVFFAVQDYLVFWTYLTVGLVFMACGTSTLWAALKLLRK